MSSHTALQVGAKLSRGFEDFLRLSADSARQEELAQYIDGSRGAQAAAAHSQNVLQGVKVSIEKLHVVLVPGDVRDEVRRLCASLRM